MYVLRSEFLLYLYSCYSTILRHVSILYSCSNVECLPTNILVKDLFRAWHYDDYLDWNHAPPAPMCKACIPLEIACYSWLPNANEINTNNIKCTCPIPSPRIGDPTPPIFHLLVLGVGIGVDTNFSVRVGGNANFSVFGYQHVGISNMKLWRWHWPTQGPNANGFALH